MTCDKCKHFKIVYEPLRDTGVIWDLGRAHCKKHNLIVDFANHGKFKRLECPDKEERMSELKLKPCPFCGGEPIPVVDDETEDFFGVKCFACGGSIQAEKESLDEAIEEWNRRAE